MKFENDQPVVNNRIRSLALTINNLIVSIVTEEATLTHQFFDQIQQDLHWLVEALKDDIREEIDEESGGPLRSTRAKQIES